MASPVIWQLFPSFSDGVREARQISPQLDKTFAKFPLAERCCEGSMRCYFQLRELYLVEEDSTVFNTPVIGTWHEDEKTGEAVYTHPRITLRWVPLGVNGYYIELSGQEIKQLLAGQETKILTRKWSVIEKSFPEVV